MAKIKKILEFVSNALIARGVFKLLNTKLKIVLYIFNAFKYKLGV